MSTNAGWNRTAQLQLISELKGFWAGDLWDMHHSPVKDLSPNAKQRRLRFRCKSAAINGELKYLCWKKFSGGEWRSTQEISRVHRMIHWLNSMRTLPSSLLQKDFSAWRDLYRAYLSELGQYKTGTTSRMDGEQRPQVTGRDSAFISTLRQACILLGQAYDLRPDREKDIWDLKRMGVPVNLSQSNVKLSFLLIKQEWLRTAVKSYLSYCLPLYSASTCRTRLQSMACFSNFLVTKKPPVTTRSITRRLLLEYLTYLQGKVRTATSKNHVLTLRNFLEMTHREGWLTIGPDRMIYDEEVPQPAKHQPRYLPATVLDQLNSHLGDLKPPWRRKILILQECGMRISELLQLPVDCLTQDARGVHYLRYMQGKVKRENAIPISLEIARIIQEQQAEGRNHDKPSMWLFPNERGGVIKQATFAHRINRLAYDHDIRDATGKLFRFQSHQFRHTVGTRMINLGVPHHIIQRYLGHRGPEMTSRYAHIHDSTMQDKLSEYLKGTLIDVAGKAVPEDGMNDGADLQWFTRSVLAQALTNGYCAIPIVAGPCPHPNACLNCAHFRTDVTFLEVHRAELHETERVIAKADANGWVRQSEMNERKRTNLINIVTTLEAHHG
jgi:site-specific recombinase XerD